MGIGAAVAILVRNDHIVAIAAGIVADSDHFAVMDGLDRCAKSYAQIKPTVDLQPIRDGMDTPAVKTGDMARPVEGKGIAEILLVAFGIHVHEIHFPLIGAHAGIDHRIQGLAVQVDVQDVEVIGDLHFIAFANGLNLTGFWISHSVGPVTGFGAESHFDSLCDT